MFEFEAFAPLGRDESASALKPIRARREEASR